jgi:hypothetical protein
MCFDRPMARPGASRIIRGSTGRGEVCQPFTFVLFFRPQNQLLFQTPFVLAELIAVSALSDVHSAASRLTDDLSVAPKSLGVAALV